LNVRELKAPAQAPETAPVKAPVEAEKPSRLNRTVTTRLDASKFPHPPKTPGANPATTIENVEHLLDAYGIVVRFDVIKKRLEFSRNGETINEVAVISLVNLNGLNSSWLPSMLHSIGEGNPLNPVADWIHSEPWDGKDRLADFYATLKVAEGYPEDLRNSLLKRFMLSATAAATLQGKRFSTRGVLTLQGPQGIGKTSWISNLIPAGALRDSVIKRDHHMDGGNKDSILGAVDHWIVEIGELDSSFKKDVARLKGFITNDCDKIRPPYGRQQIEMNRRTVFVATVNDEHFLVDSTGNTRFFTIAVQAIDFNHSIDMQQVFAQLYHDLEKGEQWWLTPEEEAILEAYNRRHRSISATGELVLDHLDLECDPANSQYRTATEVLHAVGITRPSNAQCKECGQVLREYFGSPKRVQGREKWRVPLKGDFRAAAPHVATQVLTPPTAEDRFG